ncbi:MAG: desulfoferrodoxin FeS4 iron-binding domain-containing protein [Bacillota bacterium]
MTKLRDIYKCNVCGNVVEIAHEGAGALVCCGQPMENLIAKTEDAGKEKHVPVVKECGNGTCIEVGDVHHPMEEKHYIQFVEVLTSNKVIRSELVPGQKPAADFNE